MIKLLIILIITVIIAAILFALLKKAVKLALFMALVIIIFLTITSILYPEINILQKGKNYILEKSEEKLEQGKDKVTAYIIIETNETINRAKERIFKAID